MSSRVQCCDCAAATRVVWLLILELSPEQRTKRSIATLLLQREGNLAAIVVNLKHYRNIALVDPNFIMGRSGNLIFLRRNTRAVDRDIGFAAVADPDLLDLSVVDPHHRRRVETARRPWVRRLDRPRRGDRAE